MWEREWESFTAMEAAYNRSFEQHDEVGESTVVSEHIEYYWVMA